MDPAAFRAQLTAEAYDPIVERTLPPGQAVPEHSHDWDAHGLVLAGRFSVTMADGSAQGGDAGARFVVPAGARHTEASGPEGATILVGRRRA